MRQKVYYISESNTNSLCVLKMITSGSLLSVRSRVALRCDPGLAFIKILILPEEEYECLCLLSSDFHKVSDEINYNTYGNSENNYLYYKVYGNIIVDAVT